VAAKVVAVGAFEQILQLPYAYVWLPGAVFFLVGGAIYWLTRSAPVMAEVAAEAPTVEPVPTEQPKDQRVMFRRQGNPVQVHVAFSTHKKEEPEIGSVLDRSMGGMRLALYHEVEVGVVVRVRPVHADDIVPWVDLEIRSCRPSVEMHDQYELGCQYVKSPPFSIQLLFG
jgi:hypothetical protein